MRKVEKTIVVYAARDGKQFSTEADCMKYEHSLGSGDSIKIAAQLCLPRLDSVTPIGDTGDEYRHYTWFLIRSKSDFEAVCNVYGKLDWIKEPKVYPDIMCMKSDSEFGDLQMEDVYNEFLSEMRKTTSDFWKNFGCNVIIGETVSINASALNSKILTTPVKELGLPYGIANSLESLWQCRTLGDVLRVQENPVFVCITSKQHQEQIVTMCHRFGLVIAPNQEDR